MALDSPIVLDAKRIVFIQRHEKTSRRDKWLRLVAFVRAFGCAKLSHAELQSLDLSVAA